MKQKLISIILVTLLTLMLGCGGAFAAIPDVSDDFYVADYAKVIDNTTENYIIKQNAALENLCGAQIVVATVDFLDGMDIEDYAYKMFNSWEIGEESEDNGVLLLLVIGEENYWCMRGKGLEKVLTSGDIDDILWDYLEADFAAENYSDGVRKTFDELYDVVYDYYEAAGYAGSGYVSNDPYDDYYYEEDEGDFVYLVIGVIFLIVIIAVVAALIGDTKRRRRNYGGGTVYVPVSRPHKHRRTPPPPPMPPMGGPQGGMPPRPSGGGRPAKPPRTAGGSFGKPSGGILGGSRPSGGAKPSRPSGSSGGAGRRPSGGSFGGGGIGRGGGGASRGGGAGRRGR